MKAHKWKPDLNPDVSKKAQEVVCSEISHKVNHMPLIFNAIPLAQTSHQKHLGLNLDEKVFTI